MLTQDLQKMVGMLTALVQPWQTAVENPAKVQQEALHGLLQTYAATEYGKARGAAYVDTIEDYRRAIPAALFSLHRARPLVDASALRLGGIPDVQPGQVVNSRGATCARAGRAAG